MKAPFFMLKRERGQLLMFKMPVTYRTFEGKEAKRDFYFNLNKGEIAEMNFAFDGGFEAWLENIQTDPNIPDMMKVFKELILKAYGKRLPDGQFVKTPEYTAAFAASDAYSEVFLKFIENKDNFVNTFLEGAMNISPEEIQKGLEANLNLKSIAEENGVVVNMPTKTAEVVVPESEF